MRALTVEEYAWLSDGDTPPGSPVCDDTEQSLAEQCEAEGLAARFDLDEDSWGWRNTSHGDRAVRVHRAWLQSMGVQ